ncbi:hypothetical protein B0H13DRAFT_2349132 [Mycena leptocephala]|nr:hypothetical protein B0H13DRAFT_2350370 [Mycena leptocephala]KAJ7873220.1 hypothetical protein B0H13DRAFT_2349132 [Mycena leptocephala]
MTDRVREKLVQLRAEVDAAIERAETAEKKNKDLEQTVLERDHEVKSLGVRLEHAEDALEKSEAALKETTANTRLWLDPESNGCHAYSEDENIPLDAGAVPPPSSRC